MAKTFWLVEAKAREGSNIPVGTSKDGKPCYARNWQEAEQFATREAAEHYAAFVKGKLPQYGDMTGEFIVCEHQVME